MHNPDFMLQLLVNLALHYPQAGRTPAQLQILAEDWAEDLAEFSPETVERAVKQYRRECAYFPTVADIWARCDELRRGEAAPGRCVGPAGRTLTREEQRMLNGEWCAKILALWDKMDARKQGRLDTPLDEQLANLRALGVEQ